MKSLVFLITMLVVVECIAQDLVQLPSSFKDKAYGHVSNLTQFGERNTGSSGEVKTIGYIKDFFTALNMETNIDTFSFQSYEAKDIAVFIENKKIDLKAIFFNPYKDSMRISGPVYLIDPSLGFQSVAWDSLQNHIVITRETNNIHRLYRFKPKAIVILSNEQFSKLNPQVKTCFVKLQGKINRLKSFNICSSFNNSCKKEILIGAHWDSYNGPGADDNASGVGVVMELARYFHQQKTTMPFNIRFVFFGAEELGLLGSKAYCNKHIKDTASVIYYLNVDCVGDTGAIIADIHGGKTYKGTTAQYQDNKAVRDLYNSNDQWYLDEDLLAPDESNVPSWLKDMMTATLESSDHPFTGTRGIGSDHRSFANTGFVSTHIGISGENVQHCPGDKINQVNKSSLELAGRIIATAVLKTKERQENNTR